MQLCSVEHKLNTSSTFFSSKLDSHVIKTLENIRFSSNQNIGEGQSNFDDWKWPTQQFHSSRNKFLKNPYFNVYSCNLGYPIRFELKKCEKSICAGDNF